ncbi:hypothetical protein [Afipia carboxidovorans]|uniref:hypothetical protein n=1 Tax=Afipia carboxidovorans TaxID=40137 RepID=UPI00308C8DCD|nr:hypothetical protein CRBSH125_01100 [Afipia carboxidovorans]
MSENEDKTCRLPTEKQNGGRTLVEETKKRIREGKDDAGQYPASGKIPVKEEEQQSDKSE